MATSRKKSAKKTGVKKKATPSATRKKKSERKITKKVKVQFFKLLVAKKTKTSTIEKTLSPTTVTSILNAVKTLPVQIDQPRTRYSEDEEQKCILFSDDIQPGNELVIPDYENSIPGVYFKRRIKNYPFEENGEGQMLQLHLAEANVLAETLFYIWDQKRGVFAWQANRLVSGPGGFAKYLEEKIKYLLDKDNTGRLQDLADMFTMEDGSKGHLDVKLLIDEHAFEEFEKKMDEISSVTLRVEAPTEVITEIVGQQAETTRELGPMVGMVEKMSGGEIEITVKNKVHKMNKPYLRKFFSVLSRAMGKNAKKYEVKGLLDGQTRILDLFSTELAYTKEVEYENRYVVTESVYETLIESIDYYHAQLDQ